MLYIIGIGLNDEKDVSLKGLEIIRKSDLVYLDNYTSKINCDIKKLEKLYNKKIILADRSLAESESEIINNSRKKKVSFLVIGAPLFATTHMNLFLSARKEKIDVEIINNASVFDAIAETGLFLYNFGKITSIPFDNENVNAPIEVLKTNQKNNMHTLFLLDLNPQKDKFMSINDALNYLLSKGLEKNTLCVACSQLSGANAIKTGSAASLSKQKFDKFPQCLIIPANKLHFIEEEVLNMYK